MDAEVCKMINLYSFQLNPLVDPGVGGRENAFVAVKMLEPLGLWPIKHQCFSEKFLQNIFCIPVTTSWILCH